VFLLDFFYNIDSNIRRMGDVVLKCDCCGAPAAVCLMQIANGSAIRINLCANCARARGVIDQNGAPTEQPIEESLFKATAARNYAFGGVCKVCGFPGYLFNDNKVLGCPHCYETFGSVLEKSSHCRAAHRGKTPTSQIEAASVDGRGKDASCLNKNNCKSNFENNEVMETKILLEYAIAEERYEDAAVFRDKLRGLRKNRKRERKA
jgi:protein arginine kinase activator